MILGVHHIAISTPDIERLVDFYCRLLGFEVTGRLNWEKGTTIADRILGLEGTAARQAMLRAGNCFLELFEFRSPVPRPADLERRVIDHGYTHICLHVSDIDSEFARLEAGGVSFNSPPQRRETHSALYGRDPDGNVIELMEVFDTTHPYAMTNSALRQRI